VIIWLLAGPIADSRALQKRLLADYLAKPANAVHLREGPAGKPVPVWAGSGQSPVLPSCNTSHSQHLWAFTIEAGGADVGIDIEVIGAKPRPVERLQAIAEHFFSAADRTWLDRQPDYQQSFLYLWTRKEAFVKAQGLSISQFAAAAVFGLPEWRIESWNLADRQFQAATWRAAGWLSVARPRIASTAIEWRYTIGT
jgi:phosphopantetheine--protein transferase-like protein